MLTNKLLPLTQGDHYVKRYARTTEFDGLVIRDDTRDALELAEAGFWLNETDMSEHTVLDVGAGVGCFATVAAWRGARHVQACEPDQSRHVVLKANADGFQRNTITPLRVALSNRAGKASITWRVDGHVTTQHGIAVLPMRQLCFRAPSFVKVSVHGNELEYLPGGVVPHHVRVFLLKTDKMNPKTAAVLDAYLAGMRPTQSNVKFDWSPATWYEWRRY